MGQIHIENMEFYAYHGHFEEENVVGNKFIVNLWLDTDTTPVAKSDQLADALDYVEAWKIVEQEMNKTSKLLEHVAERILKALYTKFGKQLEHAKVKVSKMNPPVGGKLDCISVELEK